MGNSVGFLEHAAVSCGLDVGFGKMFLLYADATPVAEADLNATAINAAIADGTIKGIIKGWHTVTGAPVAETNVERPGSAEMKQIRAEILADTLMFENTLANNEIIGDLVKAGTLYGVLIDDLGNVYGEKSNVAGYVIPMRLNFSGKTTTSFQKDNTSDKSVSVTVRYLVKEVQAVQAGIEVEEILSKTLISLQYVSVSATIVGDDAALTFKAIDKSTGEALDFSELLSLSATVSSDIPDLVFDFIEGSTVGFMELFITSESGALLNEHNLKIAISDGAVYSKETSFLVDFGV